MKHTGIKVIGGIALLLFSASLVHAVDINRGAPKRVRNSMQEERQEQIAKKRMEMTPEQKRVWKERRARIKAKVDKWLVDPIKRLKPSRRPGPPSEEAAERRRERLDGKVEKLVPRRYPTGESTDTASGTTDINIEPANYSTK